MVQRRKPLTIQEFARMGGKARARKLTAEQRSESARKAINARWAKTEKALAQLENATAGIRQKSKALERAATKKSRAKR
jgi:hypothetical protein